MWFLKHSDFFVRLKFQQSLGSHLVPAAIAETYFLSSELPLKQFMVSCWPYLHGHILDIYSRIWDLLRGPALGAVLDAQLCSLHWTDFKTFFILATNQDMQSKFDASGERLIPMLCSPTATWGWCSFLRSRRTISPQPVRCHQAQLVLLPTHSACGCWGHLQSLALGAHSPLCQRGWYTKNLGYHDPWVLHIAWIKLFPLASSLATIVLIF